MADPAFDALSSIEETRLSRPMGVDEILAQQREGSDGLTAGVIRTALPVNPDTAARDYRLAMGTGLPPPVVERNYDMVKNEQRLREIQRDLASSPVLEERMRNPTFAKITHDDTANMAAIEGKLKPREFGSVVNSAEFSQMVQDIQRMNPSVDADTARKMAAQRAIVDTSKPNTHLVPETGFGTLLEGIAASATEGLGKQLPLSMIEYYAAMTGDKSTALGAGLAYEYSKEAQRLATPKPTGAAGSIYEGFTSAGQSLPVMAAFLGGPLVVGFSALAASAGFPAFHKYLGRGATLGEANLGMSLEAASEVLTEFAPMSYVVKNLGRAGVGKFLTGLLGREIPSEMLNTIVSTATDTAIANPNKTWTQWVKELPAELGQTVVSTAVLGGLLTGIHAAAQATGIRTPAMAAAEANAKTLDEINKLITAGKVAQRDPSTLASFIDDAAKQGPVTDVYIDGNVLLQTMQQAGVTQEQIGAAMPTLAKQMAEGADAGDSFRIPLGEFMANAPALKLDQALLPHVRTSENGLSLTEAQDVNTRQPALFQAAAEKAITESADAEKVRASAAVVEQKLMAELAAANRFTADVNSKYAKLLTAFFTVMSQRARMTPEQMFAKYSIKARSSKPVEESRVLQLKSIMQKIVDTVTGAGEGPTVNIGLNVPGGGTLTPEEVMAALTAAGVNVKQSTIHQSDTEQTVVAELDRALTPEEGNAVAVALGQEAVAQHTGNKQGALYGPNAAAWGDFTPEFYLNLDGSRLAEPAAPNEVRQGPNPAEDRAIRKMLENLTPRERSKVGNSLAKKIIDHLTNLPSANEFAAVAYAGRAKRGWYSESAETISAIFGPDAPRFAMLLAALSPQVSVETNLGNALRIWKAWTEEGRPQDDAAILRIMGANVEGDKGEGSVLDAWRVNSQRALGYEDINDITLSGPKVNSFYLNLIGDVLEVTNDTWMARFAAVDQTMFKGGLNPRTGDPGKGSGYLAFNARVREAAKVLTKMTGETWTPAEVQETVWTWAQGLMELANSADETRKPSEIIKEKGLEHALTRSTAGFGSLLLQDKYRSILEEAGYADELARLAETDDGATAAEPGADIGLEGEAGPFAEAAQQRYELAAARRLDAQWEQRRAGRELYQSAGPEGTAGLAEAQGSAANLDRGSQRLDGLPDAPMLIDGQWYVPGPNAQAHDAAQAYMASVGLPYTRPRAYVRVDTVRAAKIAAEFEKMKHDPTDPEVALAYQALIDETLAQWQAIKATGLKVEFIDFEKQGDPYAASPRLAIMDVQDNNHLWVFPTDAGFGSDDTDISGNPLLALTDEYIGDKRLRANDVFRIVHDYFGHIKDGVGFRAEGEENAWRSHAAMFSPLARRALTTETRGQNSWVNYGPHGAKNRKASAGDTVYAPQKIGLLPQWVVDDGRMDDTGQDHDPNFPSYGTPTPGSISVLGVHFSMGERTLLSSAMYGTGAVGAERADVMNAEDSRLKDRVYFYTPEGKGIISERKVGGVAHGAKLNNIYDVTNDPLGIWAKGGESAILDAGFDGYYARNTNLLTGQGVTILLGKHNVPVSRLGFERDANAILKDQPGTRVLRQAAIDTLAFKEWFGDSKIVDADGKPRVMYHGTGDSFHVFSSNRGKMIYFSTNPEVASDFADAADTAIRENQGYDGTYEGESSGANIVPVYLSVQNLFDPNNAEHLAKLPAHVAKQVAHGDWSRIEDRQKEIQRAGFDGVFVKERGSEQGWDRDVAVFSPEQIKSATGNQGAFDPKNPNILKQDPSAARGSLSFETDITSAPSVITLLQNADLSTFLHESGHFFLEVMSHMAAQPNAPQGIVDDMNAVLRWFGVSDLATWRSMSLEEQRDFHERFARGFEAYLFGGKSPNSNMQSLFATFARWLKSVYRELTALNVQLTGEVRGVFDRMLASEEQIKETEIVRGYTAMFKTAEEMGATPEEWTAYQKLHAEATEAAVQDLQERSLRNMGWLSRLRARTVAKLTDEANSKRRALRKEVLDEVRQQPVYAVQQFLKNGVLPDGTQAVGAKLSLSALREMYGDGPAALWRYFNTGKFGLVSAQAEDSMHPDQIAEMFNFKSGDEMVRAILAADPESVVVDGMTDQRMLERYSDMADPDAIERAANDAVHNEARLKFVATELKALSKAVTPVRALTNAAKQFAETLIGRRTLETLKPGQFTAAEGRSAKAALEAVKKGDTVTAATHKRNQLVNGYAAKAATDARNELLKTVDFFRRVMRGNNEEIAKTRDVDVVQAARAILAQYGIGTSKGKTAREYMELVQKHDPQMFEVLRDDVEQAFAVAKPYTKLTVDEFRDLRELIESMWHLAKRSRQMEVGGDLLDREEVQGKLRERMDEIGVPEKAPGQDHAITKAETRLAMLQSFKAALRRVEAWVGAKDGNTMVGPFRRYIWQPVKDAADAYRADKVKFIKRYKELLDTVAPTLKPSRIDAPEIGYAFGFDVGATGKGELLHAILHTGNASNKRKLLLGRKWATDNGDGTIDTSRWDTFVARMIAEGTLTKADFDFVQSVWDLLEEMKPMAQKTHRDVFGRYFNEVTADSFVTPFGTYRGGYVPAMADPRIVDDAKTRALAEEENQSLAFAFPATAKGFTKSRVDYNRPLLLDLRSLSQHIDKVLLFSHLEQPIRDVRRVLTSKEVSYALNRIDPAASDGMLTPWLNRTARQQVETPVPGSNGLMRFFSAARSRAGMAAMFANVSNTVQQVTGFSLAAVRVPPSKLISAMADFAMNPREMARTVAEQSPYMATRMDQEIRQLNDAVDDILLNPSVYESVTAWTARHAYFLQSAVDNVMGPIIWTGAYNDAIEKGQTEADAKRLADSAVRETQGSTLPEDVSRIETGNAFVRLFTQFAGYFNMQANLLGSEFQKSVGELGLKAGAGRAFYVFLFGFLVPAWCAEAIALAFKGGPGDDDKDGNYLDDWLKSVFLFGTLRNATAMIPAVGPIINAAVNTTNSKPYDDRISTAPAISMIESAVRAPQSVYNAIVKNGKESKAIKDVATLVTLLFGVPATVVARPIAYWADVHQGKTTPANPVDAVRGTITGQSPQK